eukprot:Sspe_Gene.18872::Locus_6823_Transcript_1_1_Confidence_1.000_Length_3094::g.18872::m.18872
MFPRSLKDMELEFDSLQQKSNPLSVPTQDDARSSQVNSSVPVGSEHLRLAIRRESTFGTGKVLPEAQPSSSDASYVRRNWTTNHMGVRRWNEVNSCANPFWDISYAPYGFNDIGWRVLRVVVAQAAGVQFALATIVWLTLYGLRGSIPSHDEPGGSSRVVRDAFLHASLLACYMVAWWNATGREMGWPLLACVVFFAVVAFPIGESLWAAGLVGNNTDQDSWPTLVLILYSLLAVASLLTVFHGKRLAVRTLLVIGIVLPFLFTMVVFTAGTYVIHHWALPYPRRERYVAAIALQVLSSVNTVASGIAYRTIPGVDLHKGVFTCLPLMAPSSFLAHAVLLLLPPWQVLLFAIVITLLKTTYTRTEVFRARRFTMVWVPYESFNMRNPEVARRLFHWSWMPLCGALVDVTQCIHATIALVAYQVVEGKLFFVWWHVAFNVFFLVGGCLCRYKLSEWALHKQRIPPFFAYNVLGSYWRSFGPLVPTIGLFVVGTVHWLTIVHIVRSSKASDAATLTLTTTLTV